MSAGGAAAREKELLRRELRARRRQLEERACRDADQRIGRALLALPQYRRAAVVFSYVSAGREVDTRAILCQALKDGKRVAVPRCVPGRPGVMEACEIRSLDELAPGAFGIPEPAKDRPAVAPGNLSLCVVPCLAADPDSGARLGYGGGYYDRYLAGTDAFRAALCREAFLERRIPAEPHDRPVDAIVTEERVIRFAGA